MGSNSTNKKTGINTMTHMQAWKRILSGGRNEIEKKFQYIHTNLIDIVSTNEWLNINTRLWMEFSQKHEANSKRPRVSNNTSNKETATDSRAPPTVVEMCAPAAVPSNRWSEESLFWLGIFEMEKFNYFLVKRSIFRVNVSVSRFCENSIQDVSRWELLHGPISIPDNSNKRAFDAISMEWCSTWIWQFISNCTVEQ